MTQELDSFEEAAEAAMAELEAATSDDSETSSPEVEEEAVADESQVDPNENEQAESQSQETETEEAESEKSADEDASLFEGLDESDEEDTGVDPNAPINLDQLPPETPISFGPGHEPTTLRELVENGLRLEDYTRKTQEVAEQRKSNERAVKLWEALQKEPLAVAKQLAVEAGLLDKDDTPVRAVDFAPIQTQEDLEAEVEKRVEQRLEDHPDVQEARKQKAWKVLNDEFDRLESVFDVQLNEASRSDILAEAKARGVSDLELVASNMLSRRAKKAEERKALKEAAPNRSTGQTQTTTEAGPVDSFEEAAERALVELGMAG